KCLKRAVHEVTKVRLLSRDRRVRGNHGGSLDKGGWPSPAAVSSFIVVEDVLLNSASASPRVAVQLCNVKVVGTRISPCAIEYQILKIRWISSILAPLRSAPIWESEFQQSCFK